MIEPTIPVVAPLRGDGYEHAGTDYALISLTHLWDWTGFPVAALPAGVGRSGLPVGVSLIGPAGSDWELLAARCRAAGGARRARAACTHAPDCERIPRMTLRPKTPKDLLLAPVAAEIDQNLHALRDMSPGELGDALAIALNVDRVGADRAHRAARILDEALRGVELHHWDAEITDDAARLRLSGGSVAIELGLSPSIRSYIENGPGPA